MNLPEESAGTIEIAIPNQRSQTETKLGGSKIIQDAVEEKFKKMDRGRLERGCSKLDPDFEKTLAEEGLSEEAAQWPVERGQT